MIRGATQEAASEGPPLSAKLDLAGHRQNSDIGHRQPVPRWNLKGRTVMILAGAAVLRQGHPLSAV
jgi:hypothetical protein